MRTHITLCVFSFHYAAHTKILGSRCAISLTAAISLDHEHDLARGFTVTESGITVVPKGTVIDD